MKRIHLFWLMIVSASAHADLVIAPGLDIDGGSRSVQIPAGMVVGVIDTGSGSVRLGEKSGAERIDTGSGSVRLGAGAISGDIDTGSGSVSLDVGAQAGMIDTGSGGVEIDDGARTQGIDTGSGEVDIGADVVVDGDIDTGSGSVRVGKGSEVIGKIDTGSGGVDLRGARVDGVVDVGSGDITLIDSSSRGILTTSGDVRLSGNTQIDGDLRVRDRDCWGICWGKGPVISVGAGVVISGQIVVEDGAEADVRVDPSARVGGVVGTQATGIAERNE